MPNWNGAAQFAFSGFEQTLSVFGWTIDEQRSFAVLDAYVQAGGNFIDTADSYGRRGSGGVGESERIIGRWIAARGNREQLVIATKVGMSPELPGLSEQTIKAGAAASLERLGVDRIDLYYAHQDDPRTPLEETLRTLDQFIRAGQIRYYGLSNFTGWQLTKAVHLARTLNVAEPVTLHSRITPSWLAVARVCPHGPNATVVMLPGSGLARGVLSVPSRSELLSGPGSRRRWTRSSWAASDGSVLCS